MGSWRVDQNKFLTDVTSVSKDIKKDTTIPILARAIFVFVHIFNSPELIEAFLILLDIVRIISNIGFIVKLIVGTRSTISKIVNIRVVMQFRLFDTSFIQKRV